MNDAQKHHMSKTSLRKSMQDVKQFQFCKLTSPPASRNLFFSATVISFEADGWRRVALTAPETDVKEAETLPAVIAPCSYMKNNQVSDGMVCSNMEWIS